MKRIFLISSGLALMVLVTTSCLTSRDITIEIMDPAIKVIPSHMSTVALISRNFKFSGDTLRINNRQNKFLQRDHNNRIINVDSLATTSCLVGVTRQFKENKVSVNTKIIDYRTFDIEYGRELSPIPWTVIEDICKRNKADGVIALETYSYHNSVRSNYNNRFPAPESKVTYAALWSFYDPVKKKIIDTHTSTDTVVWDSFDYNQPGNRLKIPNRIESIQEASLINGENYANRLSVHWIKVNRKYYIPASNEFKEAASLAQKGNWEQATGIWLQIAQRQTNPRHTFFALYNLALASEMQGNTIEALSWAEKAFNSSAKLADNTIKADAFNYVRILKKRVQLVEKIKNQMDVVNPRP
ncbi:MAG: DUF6340 family protein [Bacteroidota bacterium]|nr:DUF6340 family protein [Bacteroidota bacterium]MDP4205366.1 DUF6340 family protein [Bacteroidota bacterium]